MSGNLVIFRTHPAVKIPTASDNHFDTSFLWLHQDMKHHHKYCETPTAWGEAFILLATNSRIIVPLVFYIFTFSIGGGIYHDSILAPQNKPTRISVRRFLLRPATAIK